MWSLAQAYGFNSTTNSGRNLGVVLILPILILIIVSIAAFWKIFTKAGQSGWKSIIPIYNYVIELRIIGLSGWYVLLGFIPFVNIIFGIYITYRLARAFGHGIGMALLMLLVIGIWILGFGKSKYIGPNGQAAPPASGPKPNQTPPTAGNKTSPPVTPSAQ